MIVRIRWKYLDSPAVYERHTDSSGCGRMIYDILSEDVLEYLHYEVIRLNETVVNPHETE